MTPLHVKWLLHLPKQETIDTSLQDFMSKHMQTSTLSPEEDFRTCTPKRAQRRYPCRSASITPRLAVLQVAADLLHPKSTASRQGLLPELLVKLQENIISQECVANLAMHARKYFPSWGARGLWRCGPPRRPNGMQPRWPAA